MWKNWAKSRSDFGVVDSFFALAFCGRARKIRYEKETSQKEKYPSSSKRKKAERIYYSKTSQTTQCANEGHYLIFR